jgi:hypothetical protein
MLMLISLATLILTLLSMFLSLGFFRVLAHQEHEALKLQTRHNRQLVQYLLDHTEPGLNTDKSHAFVQELREEMVALRAEHNRRARWWFRRRYDVALS